jgi:hypothetical protein
MLPPLPQTCFSQGAWKGGFDREGIIRSGAFKDGKVMDMFMYSLINFSI